MVIYGHWVIFPCAEILVLGSMSDIGKSTGSLAEAWTWIGTVFNTIPVELCAGAVQLGRGFFAALSIVAGSSNASFPLVLQPKVRGERIIRYSNIIRIVEAEYWYSYSYSGDFFKPNNIRIRIRSIFSNRIIFVFVFGQLFSSNRITFV